MSKLPHNASLISRLPMLVLPVLLAPVALSGCMGFGGEKDLDLSTYVEETDPADKLYNEGLANMNAGRMGEAIKKFEAVDRQHPYSEYARKSLVMGAFANYRQGNYDEAISGAKRYMGLYPTSPDAAYAQYIIGLSWYRQIRDVTQDQKEARRTVEAMDELVQRWPESEYVEDAKAKMRFARDQLAGKEMQVGRFYLARKDYTGAINRFRVVVSQYQQTRHIEEALHRLVEAYLSLGIVGEAQTAAAILGHNYPDGDWYKQSYALLNGSGLQPQQNNDSWISRAFGGGNKTAAANPPA